MKTDTQVWQPALRFLSTDNAEEIHSTAMEILEDIGQRVMHPEAIELLKTAGCEIEGDTVKISSELVKQCVESAPKNISVFNREGEPAMDLGGRRAYFGTGSDLNNTLDSVSGDRHKSLLEDVRRVARVCDALPNIDFVMSSAHPSDIPPERAFLESFFAMVSNTSKPTVATAAGRKDLAGIWEIARIVRGGGGNLKDKPYFVYYGEPVSPLRHSFDSLDKLLFCAEKAIPAIYSPAPISGSTAPVTIAGHIAQGLAECFCGLAIHQLRNPDAPFLMGMGAAVLDMQTGQCSYNAPEYLMAYMGTIEMSHYYNLPSWGYAGTSDSQVPDGQATFEAGLLSFLSTFAGANLNHDVGYLDFGLTGSLEMMVISNEQIGMIRRMKQGIPVNKDTLAIDAIREAAPKANFLTHKHTRKHLRKTQWRPEITNRLGYDGWIKAGKPTYVGRAAKKLGDILDTHKPIPLPNDMAQEIEKSVLKSWRAEA